MDRTPRIARWTEDLDAYIGSRVECVVALASFLRKPQSHNPATGT